MTKLLTDSDFAQIRTAVNDISESFLQKTVVYKRKIESLDRMNRDLNVKGSFSDVNLDVLVVWEQTEVVTDRTTGTMDLSDGYILVNYDAIAATSLMISVKLITNVAIDKIVLDGSEMRLIGIETLGQLKDTFTMVKFYVKRKLKNI